MGGCELSFGDGLVSVERCLGLWVRRLSAYHDCSDVMSACHSYNDVLSACHGRDGVLKACVVYN